MASDHNNWQSEVNLRLAMQAKIGTTITYQELAEDAKIPPPHRIHKLTLYLETLVREDFEQGHLIRASLVISKIRGVPAPGFFNLLAHLGITVEDENSWHLNYIKRPATPSE